MRVTRKGLPSECEYVASGDVVTEALKNWEPKRSRAWRWAGLTALVSGVALLVFLVFL